MLVYAILSVKCQTVDIDSILKARRLKPGTLKRREQKFFSVSVLFFKFSLIALNHVARPPDKTMFCR